MNHASRALSDDLSASLGPAIMRRRRARPMLLSAPPSTHGAALPEPISADWQHDLRFFVGCYLAGLVFFLIMLS